MSGADPLVSTPSHLNFVYKTWVGMARYYLLHQDIRTTRSRASPNLAGVHRAFLRDEPLFEPDVLPFHFPAATGLQV